jgi:HSP20 family protein
MTTWNPINELEAMRQQIDRAFHQIWRGAKGSHSRAESSALGLIQPAIEVFTPDEKTLVAQIELPGMQADDVTVEVSEDTLYVAGEFRRQGTIDEDAYYRTERLYGRFERHVPLPYPIKEGEAKATFKHGLLSVRAPLAEPVKRTQARKLTIER